MSGRIFMAMSGGVDSSVAALKLIEAGYSVTGVTLRLFDNRDIGDSGSTCCSVADVQDARAVCMRLGIDHIVLNFGELFRQTTISRFISGYACGQTPNPCIDCNRFIKFDALLKRARLLGFDAIATGHYAKVDFDGATDRYLLKRAQDPGKDQSYVLYMLTQDQLAHTLFPLGELTKSQVRDLAQQHGFVNAEKPDSQDICFAPDGDYAAFIERQTGKPAPEGDFVDTQGRVIGRHRGLIRYTIGQRRGLGISSADRLYVLSKDADKNTVTVGEKNGLFTPRLIVRDVNFISVAGLTGPYRAQVKIRYRHPAQPALLTPLADGAVQVDFDSPQRGAAPGQAAVFYDGDSVLGGGTISPEQSGT